LSKELKLFVVQNKIDKLVFIALIDKQENQDIEEGLEAPIRKQTDQQEYPPPQRSGLLPKILII